MFFCENHARNYCAARVDAIHLRMTTYPRSCKEMTRGMMYFPRMLDKIRLLARGELHEDYQENFGAPQTADSACCNFLRVHHRDLIERVKQGGTDEEILEWCFENGRRLNQGDLFVWNGFASKLGWRDSATSILEESKKEAWHCGSGRHSVHSGPDRFRRTTAAIGPVIRDQRFPLLSFRAKSRNLSPCVCAQSHR